MQSQYFDIYCNALYVKTASEAYFQIKGDSIFGETLL